MDILMAWRLISDDDVTASFGLAADDALAQRAGSDAARPTLRLYTYRSHCALVGRFQHVQHELHDDACRELGVVVNRRPTGGGAILMGADQLGVALTIPGQADATYGRARELMARFSEGVVRGLAALGVQAGFYRKNDIEVGGRKIAGLGIYRAPSGGLLFHASLLVDLDVPLMLRVLNTPFEKISDKEIATVAARITTVRRAAGRPLALDDVRRHVAAGYAAAFHVDLAPADFTPDERQAIAALEQERYLTDAWIYQTTAVPDMAGVARVKLPGGLLDVRASLAGRQIKAVFIGGDFFAADHAIADLEARLRWHSSDSAAITATVERWCARWPSDLTAISPAALSQAIQLAVRHAAADVQEPQTPVDPYGCFVTPGGQYG